jgi:glycine dehydrogenase subunit 1
MSVDPMALALIKTPSDYGADIVTGEGQVFGNQLSFGGPYLGIFACTEKLIRRMPGRIVGATTDNRGQRGFVLTLQTREQHIRREKATSNICTNEGLNALAATVYLALMGKEGLRQISELCLQKAHYLSDKISKIKGYRLYFRHPFFKEFVIQTPGPARQVIKKFLKEKIFPGIDLAPYGLKNGLLVAVTEKRTREQLDHYIEILKKK